MGTDSAIKEPFSEVLAYGNFRVVFHSPHHLIATDIARDHELADFDTQIVKTFDKTISLVNVERLLNNLVSAASVDIGVDGGDASVLSFDLSRHAPNVADAVVGNLIHDPAFHRLILSVDRTARKMFSAFAGSTILDPLDLLVPMACGERGYNVTKSSTSREQIFTVKSEPLLYYDVNGIAGGLYSIHYPLFADFYSRRNKEIAAGLASTRDLEFEAYIVSCLAGPITQALIFFACCRGAARLYQRRVRGDHAWRAQSFGRDLDEPRPDLGYASYLTIGNRGLRRSINGLSFLNDVIKDLFNRVYIDSMHSEDSQDVRLLRATARVSGKFSNDELNVATGLAIVQYTPYAHVSIVDGQDGVVEERFDGARDPISSGDSHRTGSIDSERAGKLVNDCTVSDSSVTWDSTCPEDSSSSVSIAWALGL